MMHDIGQCAKKSSPASSVEKEIETFHSEILGVPVAQQVKDTKVVTAACVAADVRVWFPGPETSTQCGQGQKRTWIQ